MILLKRLATAALSFAVLSGASPVSAHAMVATPAPAQTPAQAALLQNWLADTAAWTQGYDALTTSRVDTLVWLLDSTDVLLERLVSGGSAAAKPWAEAWAVEARSRLAAEMEVYRGLSTQAPVFPASLPLNPALEARVRVISQTSDQVGTLMISTNRACEDYVRVLHAAASGESDDLEAVDDARLGMMIAQLEAEVAMIRAGSVGMEGPNLHFARAQIWSNQAMIVWMHHNKKLFSGEPVDGAAAARDIREHIAAMRVEVVSMERALDVLEAQMAAQPGFNQTDLGTLYSRVVVSLRESAAVETKLADAMDPLAEAVLSGDVAAYEQPAARVEVLANERVRLDAARRQLIADAGG